MENVLLVFGGKSYEHDISVVTASQIFNKTCLKEYNLIPFYISRDNKFYIYNSKEFNISDFSVSNFICLKKKFKEVALIPNENKIIFLKTKLGLREYFKTETAIMCCHGGNGENGILEAVFESCGIYSSAGNIDSLAVCMNKYLFKQMMYGLKIPTVKGFKINEKEYLSNTDEIICKIKKINFPIVLKPNNGGSSIGLFIVNNIGELEEKLGYAFEFDSEVLIEKYIPKTREFNVAVLGDYNDFELSEIDEPLKENEILTFSDKYCSSRSGKLGKLNNDNKLSMASSFRNFPANISDRIKNRLYKLTKKIFKSLNLRGVVRIDYLYDEINNKIYVCEVNAIPGSLAYYFFNNDKLIINEFVIKLIKLAKKYKNSKFCVKNEFITDILN